MNSFVARFDTISGTTFGNQFVGRVANPDEAPLLRISEAAHRSFSSTGRVVEVRWAAARQARRCRHVSREVQGLGDVLEIEENLAGDDGVKIQDIIYKYIDGEQNLQVLPEPDLNDAVPCKRPVNVQLQ